MNKEQIIKDFMTYLVQFKFWHWQTLGDNRHRTYGKLFDELQEPIDSFTEAAMGKYGRPTFEPDFTLSFKDISNANTDDFIIGFADYLVNLTDQLDPRQDTDLLNLRDEMLGMINQARYLLTLKY